MNPALPTALAPRAISLMVALLLAPSGFATGQGAVPDATRLGQGQQLFIQHDLDGADRVLEGIGPLAPPRIRAVALRMRAVLAWRYRRDWDSARKLLDEAVTVPSDRAAAYVALGRMEEARGHYAVAIEMLRAAFGFVETASEAQLVAERFGNVAVSFAGKVEEGDPGVSLGPDVKALLAEAKGRLRPIVAQNRGALGPARVLLRVALHLGDGPAALEAWRSYFLTIVGQEDAGVLDGPRRTLEQLLPTWGVRSPTEEEVGATVLAFAHSGLLREAVIAATSRGWNGGTAPGGAEAKLAVEYVRFALRAGENIDEYYRLMSIGSPDTAGALNRTLSLAEPLWKEIPWADTPPALEAASLRRVLDSLFNAELNVGRTAGYPDVHYGHRVIDTRLAIEQYGRQADLRFIGLDGMISNGFQSWAWDFRQQHGGWARTDEIIQVRSAYAGGGLRIWQTLTDSIALRRAGEDRERETENDWARADGDPVGYLPGLAARLQAQGVRELVREIEGEGIPEGERADSFLVRYEQSIFGSSIVAHEGRHAIDRRLGLRISAADREFHAKLSEVVFAERPRLAFGGIISSNIGGSTPHGVANRRIMEGLLSWMEGHADAIAGLDQTRPLLPQLDRLTDDQLRAAMRSMDPLAG